MTPLSLNPAAQAAILVHLIADGSVMVRLTGEGFEVVPMAEYRDRDNGEPEAPPSPDRAPVTGQVDLDKLAISIAAPEAEKFRLDGRRIEDFGVDLFKAGFNEGLISQADAHPQPTDPAKSDLDNWGNHLHDLITEKAGEILALMRPNAEAVGNSKATDPLQYIPQKRLDDLAAMYQQAKADPNADIDYLRGYNNGVILAHATIFGHEPDFIQAMDIVKAVESRAELLETIANQEKLTAELRGLTQKAKDDANHWHSVARDRADEINSLSRQVSKLQVKLDDLRALIDK